MVQSQLVVTAASRKQMCFCHTDNFIAAPNMNKTILSLIKYLNQEAINVLHYQPADVAAHL